MHREPGIARWLWIYQVSLRGDEFLQNANETERINARQAKRSNPVFAPLLRWESERHTSGLAGCNEIDVFAVAASSRQDQLDSPTRRTRTIHDLHWHGNLLTCKRRLRGFRRYRYICQVEQGVRD